MARDPQALEALASSLKNRISMARDVMRNDRYYEDERKRLTENITLFQAQLDTLIDLRENGERKIDEWRQELDSLNAERQLVSQRPMIEKLLAAQEKLNELQSKQG
jgi:phage shock protein A